MARLSFAATLAVLLAGCSDTSLQLATPRGVSVPVPPPTQTPQGGGDPLRPPSPWDDLDPGQLPDEHFVLSWYDLECCEDIDPVRRWDVVDVRGQVIAEFEPPVPGFSNPVSLHADGPGRFLAVSTNDGTGDSLWTTLVWRGDAVNNTTIALLQLGGAQIHVPATGLTIDVPWEESLYQAQVLPDLADPGRLWVLTADIAHYGQPLLGRLYSIPLWGSEEVRIVDASDLVPPGAVGGMGAIPRMPWYARPFLLDERPSLVLGLDVWLFTDSADADAAEAQVEPPPDEALHHLLVAWTAEEGVLDARLDLTGLETAPQIRLAPAASLAGEIPSLGTAVWPSLAGDGCGMSSFSLWDGATQRAVSGTSEIPCPALGPLFEAQAPTFVYWGTPAGEWGHHVVVSHAGEDVWTWDRLRLGLSERRFQLWGLERLDPVE